MCCFFYCQEFCYEREDAARKNRLEKEKQDKILADERANAQTERERLEAKVEEHQKEIDEKYAAAEKIIAEDKIHERKALAAKIAQVTCPECGHKFIPED